jgi:hypothetical protein
MAHFDTTPTGRILTLVSKDLDEVDVRLPMTVEQFLTFAALIFNTLVLISSVLPWFMIGIPFMGVLFWCVIKLCLESS